MHFNVAISARNHDPSSSKTHRHFHSSNSPSRPSRIQGKLGIKGSRALMSRSLIIFGSAPWRLSVSYDRYPFRFIAAGAVWRCMTTCLVFGICVREPRRDQSVQEQRKLASCALWQEQTALAQGVCVRVYKFSCTCVILKLI